MMTTSGVVTTSVYVYDDHCSPHCCNRLLHFNSSYNVIFTSSKQVRESVLEVEYPLIEGQFKDIDEQLKKAEAELNWTTDGVYSITVINCCIIYS